MELHDFLKLGAALIRTDPIRDAHRFAAIIRDIEECEEDADRAMLERFLEGRAAGRIGKLVPPETRSQLLPLCRTWNAWGDGRDKYIEYLEGDLTWEQALANNTRMVRFHRDLSAWAGGEDLRAVGFALLRVMEAAAQHKKRGKPPKSWTVDDSLTTLW